MKAILKTEVFKVPKEKALLSKKILYMIFLKRLYLAPYLMAVE